MTKSGSYQRIIFPILSRIDAETTHVYTLSALSLAQRSSLGRAYLRHLGGNLPKKEISLFGLKFPNIIGIAAGFDKDVQVIPGLAALGFGHIETGTITPKPQTGNPRPRIFRLKEDAALINHMGFPSSGMETAAARLRVFSQKERSYVIGVSIGKQKETPLQDAVNDYLTVLRATYPFGDYFAVNISSPNTPELRKLQGSDYLADLLSALVNESEVLAGKDGGKKRPLLVKISPDLSWSKLDDILQAILDQNIDGIIATNTTLSRDGLQSANQNKKGGLSGALLTKASTEIIRYIAQHTEGKLPIIGVGGISSTTDVQAKIEAGASLVQIYTGLIYKGPKIAGRILRDLEY